MRLRPWKKPRKLPLFFLGILSLLLLGSLLLTPGLWSGADIGNTSGTVGYTENQWVLEDNNGRFIGQVNNHEYYRFPSNVPYRMHTAVTYNGTDDENPYMFLEVYHRYVRVFLGDKLLFSHMPEDTHKWDNSRSPGYIHKAIPLPDGYQGTELIVEFTAPLKSPIEYSVPTVYFGDYASTVRAFVKRDMVHNMVSLLCLILGLSALIFSTISFSGTDYWEGFNIGTFSLLVSLYYFAECGTNYYLIGNPYYLYFINLIAFSLMPVSFMGVMRAFLSGVRRKICSVAVAAEMAFFVLELLLHMTGVLDMREMLPAIHAIGFAEVLLVFGLFLSVKNRQRRTSLLLQLLPIAAGTVADAIIYWEHLEIGLSDTTFTTLGLLIFLFKQLICKIIRHSRRLIDMQQHTIEGMAALIESRDGSTGAHVRNTGVFVNLIATELYRRHAFPQEIDKTFVKLVSWMAMLHDVGKIKISDTILNKPGKFTPEEYEIMKKHAEYGGEIIRQILSKDTDPDMLQMAVDIATYHHERWDGRGYPKGLKGEQIPLCARIMAVADAFDAMSSKRVYKPEMSMDDVFEEIERCSGSQFQKEIVDATLAIRPQLEEAVCRIHEDSRQTVLPALPNA